MQPQGTEEQSSHEVMKRQGIKASRQTEEAVARASCYSCACATPAARNGVMSCYPAEHSCSCTRARCAPVCSCVLLGPCAGTAKQCRRGMRGERQEGAGMQGYSCTDIKAQPGLPPARAHTELQELMLEIRKGPHESNKGRLPYQCMCQ